MWEDDASMRFEDFRTELIWGFEVYMYLSHHAETSCLLPEVVISAPNLILLAIAELLEFFERPGNTRYRTSSLVRVTLS